MSPLVEVRRTYALSSNHGASSSTTITVEVTGMQPGVYEVSVEGKTAVSATFDGRSLKRQRTFGTWAVTGMFDTLARDLETNERLQIDPVYVRDVYREQIEEFIEAYRRACAETRIDYVMTDTSVPYDFMLSRYIAKRNMP